MKDNITKLGGPYRRKTILLACSHIENKDNIAKFGGTYRRKIILPSVLYIQ